MDARNKRINAENNAVFDIYRDGRFLATVECRGDWTGGLKVLLGALQPLGKERAWDAIRKYENINMDAVEENEAESDPAADFSDWYFEQRYRD
jgi:hypothetical protein